VRAAAWLDLPAGALRVLQPALAALARRGARAVVFGAADGASEPGGAGPAAMGAMGIESRARPQPAGSFALLDGQVAWLGGCDALGVRPHPAGSAGSAREGVVGRAESRELTAPLARLLTGEP
jgi:hypothetical protein